MASNEAEPMCREKRRRAGLPYPKSGCDVCGSILGTNWHCAEEATRSDGIIEVPAHFSAFIETVRSNTASAERDRRRAALLWEACMRLDMAACLLDDKRVISRLTATRDAIRDELGMHPSATPSPQPGSAE